MRLFCIIGFILLVCGASAQTRREVVRTQIDSALTSKYVKISYDTNYIERPKGRVTIKVKTNLSGNGIHALGKLDGVQTRANLHTDKKATLSMSVTYLGITAAFAINPAKLKGRNKDFEFNLNAFTNKYSFDVVYQMSKTLSGHFKQNNIKHHVGRGMVDSKILNIAGYYTFNNKRFSYPAAFTQSYIQKRSAGSWLVGFSFQGGSIKTEKNAEAGIPESRIYVGHFGIGGGYGYNWVLSKKWLLHASALPTLALFNSNSITLNGERRDMHAKFPDMIFNERVAIVRNFSEKYFAGATFIMSNTLFNDDEMKINQNKWRVRAFFGFRL